MNDDLLPQLNTLSRRSVLFSANLDDKVIGAISEIAYNLLYYPTITIDNTTIQLLIPIKSKLLKLANKRLPFEQKRKIIVKEGPELIRLIISPIV